MVGPDLERGGVHQEDRRVVLELGEAQVALLARRVADQQGLAAGVAFERDAQGGRGQPGVRFGRRQEAGDAQVGQGGHGLGRRLGVGQRVERRFVAPFGGGRGHAHACPRLADERVAVVVGPAADGDGARLEVGDLEDLVHAVGLRLGLERGHQGFGKRDDAATVRGEEEAFPRVGHQAHLGFRDAAGFAGHLQRPARLRQAVGGEPFGLGREALVEADEAQFVLQALDGPDVGRPVEGRGHAPDRIPPLQDQRASLVRELDLVPGRREDEVRGLRRGPVGGRGPPHEAEGDEVGDEEEDGGAGDPHGTVNFCVARRKPQARPLGPATE